MADRKKIMLKVVVLVSQLIEARREALFKRRK